MISTSIIFIQNNGQLDKEVLYYSVTPTGTLWITRTGLEFSHHQEITRLEFLNANKDPQIVSLNPTLSKFNYFIGNDQYNWRKDIPAYNAVLYQNLYKNIDLKIYGINGLIEYDWIIHPGGQFSQIKFEYSGAKNIIQNKSKWRQDNVNEIKAAMILALIFLALLLFRQL